MRTLLLHPEDSPRRGPWSRQRWDLIIDLGKSSAFSADAWGHQYGCSVLRAESFRELADAKLVRQNFAVGRGRLVDEEGIDWWDLTSLLLVPELLDILAFQRLAAEINSSAEFWSTRPGGPATALGVLLERKVHYFGDDGLSRSAAAAFRYAGLLRRFTPGQLKEIFLDKYDSGYGWRSRFAASPKREPEPVVLVPSAYGNVSRMAAAYARLLPQQNFLLVATRQNARRFAVPHNIRVRDLASYAKSRPPAKEIESLQRSWIKLRTELCASPYLRALSRAGNLEPISNWIRDGLAARNAWRSVIEREPVLAVLCGDDSNRYTRLPVLLAAKRNIPTVDFHHGAFDGRYLIKDLPCDLYLAKNEVERDYLLRTCGLPEKKIVIGAPPSENWDDAGGKGVSRAKSIVFFSEPYEVVGMRAEEVFRELLPALCRLAREHDRDVTVKLHPFESRTQRSDLFRQIFSREDFERVRVIDGPLTHELLWQAWFGMTVESTTVMDCLRSGVRCFLCGWLTLSPYGYLEQFARWGIGEVLNDAEEIANIPERLAGDSHQQAKSALCPPTIDPATLKEWLISGRRERAGAKPVA